MKFRPGRVIRVGDVLVRFVQGAKAKDDVRIDMATIGGGWVAVEMSLLFLLFEGLYLNEDRLYPPPARGGEYLLEAFRRVPINGWESERDKLETQRAAAEQRRRAQRQQLDAVRHQGAMWKQEAELS